MATKKINIIFPIVSPDKSTLSTKINIIFSVDDTEKTAKEHLRDLTRKPTKIIFDVPVAATNAADTTAATAANTAATATDITKTTANTTANTAASIIPETKGKSRVSQAYRAEPEVVYPITRGLMLAEESADDIDPTGWWASEKYDGVRVLWDGVGFWTRASHPINPPTWFTSRLPPGYSLDGELFIKRNYFNRTSGIIRNKIPNESDWLPIKYMVFDIPHLGQKLPFEKRMQELKETVNKYGEPLTFVNQIKVKSAKHLNSIHHELIKNGAEGTMIRQPQSFYVGSRSSSLLKIKDQFEEDCIVQGWEEGENRNSGRLGALQVTWADPIQIWEKFGQKWNVPCPYLGLFKVGSGLKNIDRCPIQEAPDVYPIGTRIRLAFNQLQESGKPKHPAYKGICVL